MQDRAELLRPELRDREGRVVPGREQTLRTVDLGVEADDALQRLQVVDRRAPVGAGGPRELGDLVRVVERERRERRRRGVGVGKCGHKARHGSGRGSNHACTPLGREPTLPATRWA
jgi:hypothetical protein